MNVDTLQRQIHCFRRTRDPAIAGLPRLLSAQVELSTAEVSA